MDTLERAVVKRAAETTVAVGGEVPDRRTHFEAGRIGCAGGAGARSKRQPGIHSAGAGSIARGC